MDVSVRAQDFMQLRYSSSARPKVELGYMIEQLLLQLKQAGTIQGFKSKKRDQNKWSRKCIFMTQNQEALVNRRVTVGWTAFNKLSY